MNDNIKNESIKDDSPGLNGNYDTLIPTEKECKEAEEKCKSDYRALMKAKGYKIEEVKDNVKEKE